MILLVFDIFVSMTLLALIANSSNAGDANFAQGHINSCIPWIIIFLDIHKTYHLLIIKKYIQGGVSNFVDWIDCLPVFIGFIENMKSITIL